MPSKRSPKAPVPENAVWWNHLKRHPLNAAVGEAVRRLRLRRGWSLDDLAGAAGMAKSYLCGLENGAHSPTFEVMLRLEAVLGLVPGGLQRLAARRLALLN